MELGPVSDAVTRYGNGRELIARLLELRGDKAKRESGLMLSLPEVAELRNAIERAAQIETDVPKRVALARAMVRVMQLGGTIEHGPSVKLSK
jgi:hypothetical protein